MDISILGYKINLEILIFIGILYLILVGHTICGCSNFYSKIEGITPMSPTSPTSGKKEKLTVKKEGFTGANINYGESSAYSLNDNTPVDTSSWFANNLVVTPGQQPSKAVQDIINRPNTELPLPEDEMFLFANTPFKPECCPNTYSNSSGCACMNTKTYNYLITRSGNNVPYSEY